MNAPLELAIIGGGPAGLSAALMLGRARRRVAVFDAGQPRHAVSSGVHNFLTREGLPPAELRRIAWAQMAPFTTVSQVHTEVQGLTRSEGLWRVDTPQGIWHAKAVLLATGVVDEHPQIPGYRERWSQSLHHCPYCHGWESRDLKLAVLGAGPHALMMARLLKAWSEDVQVLTHGRPLDAETREGLAQHGIPFDTRAIAELRGPGRTLEQVIFDDGAALAVQTLFVQAPQHLPPLVRDLNLDLDEHGKLAVDPGLRTSAPMMWAAGDLKSPMGQQVSIAAADGARAAGMINMALMLE